jgi:hypothetical protein
MGTFFIKIKIKIGSYKLLWQKFSKQQKKEEGGGSIFSLA